MIIGEAPGANEEKQGLPFVGKAGQILNDALSQAGVPRPAVFVTNIYRHRPPDNRPPTHEEMSSHQPFLWDEFSQVRPRHVLLLGNTALGWFTGKKDIGKRHGSIVVPTIEDDIWWFLTSTKKEEITFYCTYHPAATIYNKNTKQAFFKEVAKFFEIARS